MILPSTPTFSPLHSDYFACVREVVCHWFRACVCSGHIPHHKCCSVYVISRVEIAFHTAQHHIKHFHITHHFITSYHLSRHIIPHHTIPHRTTIVQHSTSHYYIPHVPHHISQTFNVTTHLTSDHHILHLKSHYTAVCLTPPFHTTTDTSKHNIFHITQTQSTSHTIPRPQLFHTTPTFNISAHFIPHHIPHHITPPHLFT